MPRQALAQHFLVDQGVLARIIQAADLSSKDTVVEVGPGQGVLTRELVRTAGRVVAVELDPELAASLTRRLGNPPNLTVLQADARTVDLGHLGDYKVVANLPYYAANPLVRRFLEAKHKPLYMVVMVQREVAESMAALPGRMSLLSVGVQFYGTPQIICTVPPSSFRPPPKVDSAVLRIDVLPRPRPKVDDVPRFFKLVQAAFAAPRKQIRNSLALGMTVSGDQAGDFLKRAGIDARRRPGSLNLEEWIELYRAYRDGWFAEGDGLR